jgi:hypothetical protein
MFLAVSVRKLKDGATFDEFRKAWEPPEYPAGLRRVYHGRAFDDPGTIVSIGVLEGAPSELERIRAETSEEDRQSSMAQFVESASVDTTFEVIEEIEL